MEELVAVKDFDYLDEDKPVRGQKYVCLSFLNPEDVLKDKEIFYFEHFLKDFSKQVKELFDAIKTKYPESKDIINVLEENHDYVVNPEKLTEQYKFFKGVHSADIEKEFHAIHRFRPTIRGIKVRGSYDTIDEAKIRAEVLKRQGDKFDIFVGQVGCWCPWSPNPEDLNDQVYSETQLNTLMKKYKENLELKDTEFHERMVAKMSASKAVENVAGAEASGSGVEASSAEADPAAASADAYASASKEKLQ